MLDAILFDLDGTLLSMDNDHFVEVYFGYLAKKAASWGYTDSALLFKTIWEGVAAMVKNDGSRTNGEAFWECFCRTFGQEAWQDIERFNSFYENEFNQAKTVADLTKDAKKAVRLARQKAKHVILATNPIFPRCADVTRLAWLGLTLEDFDLVTDYENCGTSKPNPAYYTGILTQFSLDPSKCLMIGNDVEEDVIAANKAGISAWLMNDHVINRKNRTVECPQGSYEEMIEFLESL